MYAATVATISMKLLMNVNYNCSHTQAMEWWVGLTINRNWAGLAINKKWVGSESDSQSIGQYATRPQQPWRGGLQSIGKPMGWNATR